MNSVRSDNTHQGSLFLITTFDSIFIFITEGWPKNCCFHHGVYCFFQALDYKPNQFMMTLRKVSDQCWEDDLNSDQKPKVP